MEFERISDQTRTIPHLLVESAREWSNDRAGRLGAGIAYYSLFALIPTLALAVSLASVFFGQEEVSQQLYTGIADVIGDDVAELIVDAIDRVDDGNVAGGILPLVSLGMLLFTATFLFVAWREVVAILWDLPKKHGIGASLRRRGFAVAAVLGAGVMLTLVMLVQALIGSVASLFDIDMIGVLATAASSVASTAIGALVIAVLFKYSPAVEVAWRTVWFPAALTMVMLAIGAHGYGIYVERFGLNSAAGVAGTVFLGLVFVYYATQILLYGVEFVKVSHRNSSPA